MNCVSHPNKIVIVCTKYPRTPIAVHVPCSVDNGMYYLCLLTSIHGIWYRRERQPCQTKWLTIHLCGTLQITGVFSDREYVDLDLNTLKWYCTSSYNKKPPISVWDSGVNVSMTCSYFGQKLFDVVIHIDVFERFNMFNYLYDTIKSKQTDYCLKFNI